MVKPTPIAVSMLILCSVATCYATDERPHVTIDVTADATLTVNKTLVTMDVTGYNLNRAEATAGTPTLFTITPLTAGVASNAIICWETHSSLNDFWVNYSSPPSPTPGKAVGADLYAVAREERQVIAHAGIGGTTTCFSRDQLENTHFEVKKLRYTTPALTAGRIHVGMRFTQYNP